MILDGNQTIKTSSRKQSISSVRLLCLSSQKIETSDIEEQMQTITLKAKHVLIIMLSFPSLDSRGKNCITLSGHKIKRQVILSTTIFKKGCEANKTYPISQSSTSVALKWKLYNLNLNTWNKKW